MRKKEEEVWNYPFEKPHHWDRLDEAWYQHFLELKAYKEEFGHCRVPKTWKKNHSLAGWVARQRTQKQKMPSWRKELLDDLEFVWNVNTYWWNRHFQEVLLFRKEHGHINIPITSKEYSFLATWLMRQRQHHKAGSLSLDRKKRLEAIGFVWSPFESRWEKHYQTLKEYHQQHQHIKISIEDRPLSELYNWIRHQREAKREGRLSVEKIKKLEELGIEWQINLSPRLWLSWEENFASLQSFQEKHGHFEVPQDWEENPILWNWLRKQRYFYHLGKLSKEREEKLRALGFSMNNKIRSWEENYERLVAFFQQEGHSNVPRHYAKDTALGWWLDSQKKYYKRATLALEKQKRLEALGVQWT